MREEDIRDFLALNLSLIEDGLTLVRSEFPLPNSIGAKGYIDILATDIYGNRVVIELKRSASASRTAIHEIFKYFALFKRELSLPAHKIRGIIVSTNWHELLVPFSELVNATEYQVEGFSISVNKDGQIISASRVSPVKIPDDISVFRHSDILLFKNSNNRDSTIKLVVESLNKAGSNLSFIIPIDYGGDKEEIIFRHAIYITVVSIEKAVWDKIKLDMLTIGDIDKDDEGEEAKVLIQEGFSIKYMEELSTHDDYEIGYPEKFGVIRADWKRLEYIKQGEKGKNITLSDQEIDILVGGEEGQNQINFHRIGTPKHKANWENLKSGLSVVLMGNENWSRAINKFINMMESEYPSGSLAISIFNPMNILIWLAKTYRIKNCSYIPYAELILSNNDNYICSLVCYVSNDSCAKIKTLSELLLGVADDFLSYLMISNFGGAWESDGLLMNRLGLAYSCAIAVPDASGSRSLNKFTHNSNSIMPKRRVQPRAWLNLQTYYEKNTVLLRDFLSSVDRQTLGL